MGKSHPGTSGLQRCENSGRQDMRRRTARPAAARIPGPYVSPLPVSAVVPRGRGSSESPPPEIAPPGIGPEAAGVVGERKPRVVRLLDEGDPWLRERPYQPQGFRE